MTRTSAPIAGLHLVRYGTPADQKFLLDDFLPTYDQLILNASIVAHMPGALASFLMKRAKAKPYFIDPQTHAFQHAIENLESPSARKAGQVKRSVTTLIESYGEPIKTRVAQRRQSLMPRDFQDKNTLRGFCERVMDFQRHAIRREAEESEEAKYYDFVRKEESLPPLSCGPSLAVAPYFYMAANTVRDWLPVNVAAAQACRAMATDLPVAVQIVISKDFLIDRDLRAYLVAGYRSVAPEPDCLLLWVDDFSEQEAPLHQLEGFVALLHDLGSIAPVVNLYGGFLSVALARCVTATNLAAVAHGLEYGESRSVVPMGGGIPVAKLYHPALHVRLPFRAALRAVSAVRGFESPEAFHERVCNCSECRAVIRAEPATEFEVYGKTRPVRFRRRRTPMVMEYPTPETKGHCVRHYMWCRRAEYADELSIDSIADQLKRSLKLGRAVGMEFVAHCGLWERVLTKS